MRQATIRIELRVPEQMNEYLMEEAHSKKLSFEGLLLSYIEERMKRSGEERQRSLDERRHTRPR
jgi:hypothetical protein